MTCHEFWNQMPELEAGSEDMEHARQCPACAALLNDQRALAAGLRRMAAERGRLETPSRVEAQLLQEFWVQSGVAPGSAARRDWIRWLRWVPAVAALVALAVFLTRGRPAESPAPTAVHTLQLASEPAPDDPAVADSDFIPLPYAADTDVTDDADLVSVEVPQSALVALGLPVAVDGGSGRVRAVVALGQDGVVQAVRLLQ